MNLHRYWRVYITASTSGVDNLISFYEVEFRATSGGADQCNGGTASASHNTATAYKLFNNNDAGDYWTNGGPSAPCWFQYDFGIGVTVAVGEIRFLPRSNLMSPTDFELQWSDDGSIFTTFRTWSGINTGWVAGGERLFVTFNSYSDTVTDGLLVTDISASTILAQMVLQEISLLRDTPALPAAAEFQLVDGMLASDSDPVMQYRFLGTILDALLSLDSLILPFGLSISDVLYGTEGLTAIQQHPVSLLEILLANDDLLHQFGHRLAEGLLAIDNPNYVGSLHWFINSGISLNDTSSGSFLLLLQIIDALLVSDAPDYGQFVWIVVDTIRTRDNPASQLLTHGVVFDQLRAQSAVRTAFAVIALDGITTSENNSPAYTRCASWAIAEEIILADQATSLYHAHVILALAFILSDRGYHSLDEALADGVRMSVDLVEQWVATVRLLEEIRVQEQSSFSMSLRVLLSDHVMAKDSISFSGRILAELVRDHVRVFISFRDKDGVEYSGLVMNTTTMAVTTYSNFSFNAITSWNGTLFATNKTGLYRLDGTDDAGESILSVIKTGEIDFGTSQLKRVAEAMVGVQLNGSMVLKTITNDGHESLYQVNPSSGKKHGVLAKLAKGVKSRYWQFELSKGGEGEFALDGIEFFPIVLSRRES